MSLTFYVGFIVALQHKSVYKNNNSEKTLPLIFSGACFCRANKLRSPAMQTWLPVRYSAKTATRNSFIFQFRCFFDSRDSALRCWSYLAESQDELGDSRIKDHTLTPLLLVANLANTKWCKKPVKMTETLAHGIHLRVLCESFQMNTNMTGFRWFSKNSAYLCFRRK